MLFFFFFYLFISSFWIRVPFVSKGALTIVYHYQQLHCFPALELCLSVHWPRCVSCSTPVVPAPPPLIRFTAQLTCLQHVMFGSWCNLPVCARVCPQCASHQGPRWHCSTGCGPKQSAHAIYTWRAATFTPVPSSGAPFTSTCVSLIQPANIIGKNVDSK